MNKTPILDGLLQSDLDFAGFKPLSADLSAYVGTGLFWDETEGKFIATGGVGGSDQQFQFNQDGVLGGNPLVTYDGTVPATISVPGVSTSKAGIYLQNSSVLTEGQFANAPAIIFRQHYRSGGVDNVIEHKLEARDTVLAIQSRVNGAAWGPGMCFLPTYTGIGAVSEYNGDISITAAVLLGLDTCGTGGDGGHPARMTMFNDSTTSRPGLSMKANAFIGWAAPPSETWQGWEDLNDAIIDRPAAGVVRLKNALELKPLTVATLPTAGAGRLAYVTDGAVGLVWGNAVTGGGSSKYLVWYNGSNWTVMGK